MDDLTQDFVQNFVNLRDTGAQRDIMVGLINQLDTSNRIDLIGLLVEEGTNILDRRTQSAEAESEAQRDPAADFENLSSRLEYLRAEDGSDNTNEESSSSNQLDESVEVDPQEPTTAVATDYTDLYQETFPPGQASRLGQSVEMDRDGWRSLTPIGPVIDVLGNVDPMEQGDNRIDYRGLLPKKPKRTKRKKKKKKPYEDLIITQKKHLAKLQKMSEKLSKKMSKTKKKRRKKKVSDSY